MAATQKHTSRRHKIFNVENLLNVRSKNHGHKPVNQGSTMIKIMVTRESQITAQIVLNNQQNSNTTEMKQRTRNLTNSQTAVTVRGLYVTVPVTFEQSERSN